jgi:RNA polymerase sigma-70 factor (ECF subfamily)
MIFLVLPDDSDDDALLIKAQKGDKEAISIIYRRYINPIFAFVRMKVEQKHLAEDITSTVFEKFIKSIANGTAPNRHLRGWLFQVARNSITDAMGKMPAMSLDLFEDFVPIDSPTPEATVIRQMDVKQVRHLIRQLSQDQQDVLLLRFDQQLDVQETADVLGKSAGAVKVLQFRAIEKLRSMLQYSR